MAIVLIIVIILLIIGAVVFGGNILNPLLSILENGTTVLGILSAVAGLYFLISIYKKSKKEEDKYIGIIMIGFGALIGIGGMFLELLRVLFTNSLFLIMIAGMIFIIALKREGLIG